MKNQVLTNLAKIAYMHNPSTSVEVHSVMRKTCFGDEVSDLKLIVNGKQANVTGDPTRFRKQLLNWAASAFFLALLDS
jgi:hypothetical protein